MSFCGQHWSTSPCWAASPGSSTSVFMTSFDVVRFELLGCHAATGFNPVIWRLRGWMGIHLEKLRKSWDTNRFWWSKIEKPQESVGRNQTWCLSPLFSYIPYFLGGQQMTKSAKAKPCLATPGPHRPFVFSETMSFYQDLWRTSISTCFQQKYSNPGKLTQSRAFAGKKASIDCYYVSFCL